MGEVAQGRESTDGLASASMLHNSNNASNSGKTGKLYLLDCKANYCKVAETACNDQALRRSRKIRCTHYMILDNLGFRSNGEHAKVMRLEYINAL